MENKTEKRKKTTLLPAGVSISLIILGLILGDVAVLGNLVIISVLISIVPYFLYKYSKFMWLKGIEEQFPNFVRDLADSARSGMSFSEAVSIASKANYGKLSIEVEKMKNRLSWGTPFLRVLDIFGEKVKDSKIITEALKIIKQSYESGGNIASTLDAVAKDMLMLKEAETERQSLVKQHVFIMYGLFFVFLGISVMIIYVMVPMIQSQSSIEARGGGLGFYFSNPCQGSNMFPCDFFSGICSLLAIPEGIGCYYVALFFSVVVIQGLFTGLIAGQLGENSAIAGTKHSIIMVFAAIGIFLFLSKTGFFPT